MAEDEVVDLLQAGPPRPRQKSGGRRGRPTSQPESISSDSPAGDTTSVAAPPSTSTHDGKNTDNVTTQSMGYDRKSYSPLKQINKSNVKRLVPIWSTSLMNDMGELAAPAIYNGVMYVINGKWTFAIDVETGRQIWRTPVELEPGVQRVAHSARSTEARRRSTTASCFA